MTKAFKDETLFGFLNFGYWNLFVIWDLLFGISISQCTFNKANSLRGETKAWPSGSGLFTL